MLPIKFEDRVLLAPSMPSKSRTVGEKIDFTHYIDPFVSLLGRVSTSLLLSSLIAINYAFLISSAAQVVFHRLIYRPMFDPLDPAFKHETLGNFEKHVVLLQNRIDQLDQKFKQEHLIARDMKDLHSLTFEISESNRQLRGYLLVLQSRKDRLAVEDDIKHVYSLYQDLDKQIDDYCKREADNLLNQFFKVLDTFTRGGIDLPDNIRTELLRTWQGLDASLKDRLYKLDPPELVRKLRGKLGDLRDRMEILDGKQAEEKRIGLAQPLKLRNIGNSCYLDSVLQALACVDGICEEFIQPIQRDKLNPDEYLKKLAIQQELIQFLNVQQMNRGADYTQMEFILFLLGGPSLYRLRQEIFKSGLHPSLDNMKELTHQHDAAYVTELMIDQFLPTCKFHWNKGCSTKELPGLEFISRDELMTKMDIPLRRRVEKLEELVHWTLHKHMNKDPRRFDVEDAVNVPGKEEEAEATRESAPKSLAVKEYVEWFRLKTLPPVLTLQLIRFDNQLKKLDNPVTLPESGILDFSRYYDAPDDAADDAPKNAKYKIKSFVVHSGTYSGGHYVSYVEINGKYYLCDDTDPKCYREISKKDFLSKKNAYLVVLERLPEEE